jgi:UMF1 family MFS transporter
MTQMSADTKSSLNWKQAVPWALYDWANSAFATSVMAAFVPVLNKEYWSAGASQTVSSFRLGMTIALASLAVAVLAPALGAIADCGRAKKRFLLFFAGQGVVMTVALHFVTQGNWALGLTLYALALIGFSGANIFYDSLLINVACHDKLDIVSALGYALGYLGGGALFALNVFMVLHPATFGLADKQEAVRWAFVTVGAWWAVFTIPLLVFVPEARTVTARGSSLDIIKAGLGQLWQTIHEIRQLKRVALFLVGYWLYIDGVDTVVQMAVDYGQALHFPTEDLIGALLITQFVGFPAALVFGKLGEKLGAKAAILIGLAVYVGVCVWGYFMRSPGEFYGLAVVVGLVQGGVQALSRSLYARLIPADKAGEFFGFYNMLGKFAAILGPALMGFTALLTENSRISILAIILLFAAGAAFLLRVQTSRDRSELGGGCH